MKMLAIIKLLAAVRKHTKPKLNMKQETDIKILRNAMLFSLTIRAWSNRCQADDSKITAECDKSKLNTTKKLIESEALQAIMQHTNMVYNWCLARSMQSSIRRGVYFVKRDMVQTFEDFLSESQRLLDEKFVPALLAEYAQCKANAQKPASEGGLGELYCEEDYPTPEDLRRSFCFEWSWMSLSVPNELPEEVRQRECDKLRESFQNAQTEVVYALREGFKKIVDNAANLLTAPKNGKQRIFGKATVQTFEKFFDTFEARNLMDDAELKQLVNQARATVKGIKLDQIKNGDVRADIAQQFNAVSNAMDKLLVDRPGRKFQFD